MASKQWDFIDAKRYVYTSKVIFAWTQLVSGFGSFIIGLFCGHTIDIWHLERLVRIPTLEILGIVLIISSTLIMVSIGDSIENPQNKFNLIKRFTSFLHSRQ